MPLAHFLTPLHPVDLVEQAAPGSHPVLTNAISQKNPLESGLFYEYGVPKGIRTPVTAVKGRCPRPTRRWGHCDPVKTGGARRVRTADLNTASVALSQLSYGPRESAYFNQAHNYCQAINRDLIDSRSGARILYRIG